MEPYRRALGAILGATLVLATVAGVIAGRRQDPQLTAGRPAPSSSASTPSVAPTPGTKAPVPPAEGAWIGAWVKPEVATPEGRLAAVADFESQLGRPLDVAHVYHRWEDEFPSSDDRALAADGKTVLLSWAGTDTRQIQLGLYDDLIRERARDLKRWGAPVLLEWRWEMDRPNLQAEIWSPEDYIAAWKHIRAIYQQEQVQNVGWVWCPLAAGFGPGRAQPYYPGDDQVDWLCADTYPGPTVQPFAEAVGPFLEWARGRPHPILIGEFGMRESLGEVTRQEWLTATGEFVKTQPQIKGLVYFDSDRTESPTDSYDMSLRNAPGSMAVFSRIAREPYFSASLS